MSFKIVVDSCCDLTDAMMKSGVFVKVPLTIRSNGSSFVDDETLDRQDLLDAMRLSEDAPATSCPSPQSYLDAYGTDTEEVYVVTLSAQLSGSHNCAEQARLLMEEDHPEINVHVFNSCTAAAGEVAVAMKIKELAESGMPFKHVIHETQAYIARIKTLFVLETLENLRKNGRLTKLQAVITGALKIKLFMGGTPEGEICKLGQALTIKQALGKLVDRMAADPDHEGRTLYLCHCNCPDRAEQLKETIIKRCKFGKIEIMEAGGITTVYANDGGIVTCY